jgi:thioredoxin 1
MGVPDVESNFDDAVKAKPKVYVLFYASWCPFSRRFLPIFEAIAENSRDCLRVKIDDQQALREKYSIDTYPTVLVFQRGAVTRRLDGEPGIGLDEAKLRCLLAET